jgi:hypothetical protein
MESTFAAQARVAPPLEATVSQLSAFADMYVVQNLTTPSNHTAQTAAKPSRVWRSSKPVLMEDKGAKGTEHACVDRQVLRAERVVRAQQIGVAAVEAGAQPPRGLLVAAGAHDGDHPPVGPVAAQVCIPTQAATLLQHSCT